MIEEIQIIHGDKPAWSLSRWRVCGGLFAVASLEREIAPTSMTSEMATLKLEFLLSKKKKKKKKSVGFRGIHSNGDYLDSSMGKMAGRSKFYKTKAIFTVRNNMSSY